MKSSSCVVCSGWIICWARQEVRRQSGLHITWLSVHANRAASAVTWRQRIDNFFHTDCQAYNCNMNVYKSRPCYMQYLPQGNTYPSICSLPRVTGLLISCRGRCKAVVLLIGFSSLAVPHQRGGKFTAGSGLCYLEMAFGAVVKWSSVVGKSSYGTRVDGAQKGVDGIHKSRWREHVVWHATAC